MVKSLRVIVVGCGYIAQAEHIPGWLNRNDASVAGLVDPRVDLLTRLSARLGVPGFASLDDALTTVCADAVHICTPPGTHEALINLAASNGLHVLVEKPLALDAEAAQRCVLAAERAGVTLMVAAPRAYDTDVTHARDLIQSGQFGDLLAVESLWRLALPPVYDVLAEAPRISQAQYAQAGVKELKARLLEESIHHFGIFRSWMPDRRIHVSSVEQSGPLLHITLRFGELRAWHTNAGGVVHDERLNAYTTEGLISVRPWSPHFPWSFGQTVLTKKAGDTVEPGLARRNGYWLQLADFVNTCHGRGDRRRTAMDGVEDIRLIEAILEYAELDRAEAAE